MPYIKTAVFPTERKTKNPIQWMGYIKSQLKISRGLDKHIKNKK